MNNSDEFCFRCNHCAGCIDQPSSFDCAHHVFVHQPDAHCWACHGPNELTFRQRKEIDQLKAEGEQLKQALLDAKQAIRELDSLIEDEINRL